eukprot:Skav202862  [mRNA]  locus=scaffold3206:78352:80744:+ [translate_table: standard]
MKCRRSEEPASHVWLHQLQLSLMTLFHQILSGAEDVARALWTAVEIEEVTILGMLRHIWAHRAVHGGGCALHHGLTKHGHTHATVEQGREPTISASKASPDDARMNRTGDEAGLGLLQVSRM